MLRDIKNNKLWTSGQRRGNSEGSVKNNKIWTSGQRRSNSEGFVKNNKIWTSGPRKEVTLRDLALAPYPLLRLQAIAPEKHSSRGKKVCETYGTVCNIH